MNNASDAERLQLLQTLRLKGRGDAARIAGAWRVSEAEAAGCLEDLVAQGWVEERQGSFGLSEAGESLRGRLLDAERAQVDADALEVLYADFCLLDPTFKQLVADVQLGKLERADSARQMTPLHQGFEGLLARASALLPRLDPYAKRFEEALSALRQGDTRYLASPLVESYHGIWFEFHEDLIQASGRSRAEEEAAGADR